MALTESGHIFSWGWNTSGQLGRNYTEKLDYPLIVLLSNRTSIKKISCGYEHSFWGHLTDNHKTDKL
jgi:alpha-tubulin suppressor-like RCC1 family protein